MCKLLTLRKVIRQVGKKLGRPKKADGQKLEQFSIRLPPKLKFGLEAMARLQGRSLSQSVEWALQAGMAHVSARKDGGNITTVWDAIESAWNLEGWERTHKLCQINPALVTFEDRHACDLVDLSAEYQEMVVDWVGDSNTQGHLWRRWSSIIETLWPRLTGDSARMELAAKLRSGVLLIEALGAVGDNYTRIYEGFGHLLEHALTRAEEWARQQQAVQQR